MASIGTQAEARACTFIKAEDGSDLTDWSIFIILPEQIGVFEESLKPFIQRVLETSQGETNVEAVLAEAKANLLQVWLVVKDSQIRACVMTSIRQKPEFKYVVIEYLSGDNFDQYVHLLEIIELWGIANGCEKMEARTRKGFIKTLASRGFKQSYVIIEKTLEN